MIVLENVVKKFKDTTVLERVSFSVEKGESCGLIGLNGAGKTTLLRIILGLLQPSEGTLRVNNISPQQANGAFYRSIGVVLESDGFNGNLSFYENILFFAKCAQVTKANIEEYLATEWQELMQKREPVKLFSRGQRMQCALARAFMGEPELLILDEPTATLDIEGYKKFCSLVEKAKERGSTLLISSHRLDTISDLCTSAIFLEEGKTHKQFLFDEESLVWLVKTDTVVSVKDVLLSFNALIENEGVNWLEFSNVPEEQIPLVVEAVVAVGGRIFELHKKDLLKTVLER